MRVSRSVQNPALIVESSSTSYTLTVLQHGMNNTISIHSVAFMPWLSDNDGTGDETEPPLKAKPSTDTDN